MILKKLATFLIFVHFASGQLLKFNTDIDFVSAVNVYCQGKSSNFCSRESLKIMYEIEEKRLKAIEMEKQMKRMKSEIIRNILNMMGKFAVRL
jgi:hypothetical protein